MVHFAPHLDRYCHRLVARRPLRRREPAVRRASAFPRRLKLFLILFVFLLVASSCHSIHSSEPTIEFTSVPPGSPGGPDQLATIEGRVQDARPGQQIVIYAHSGVWWVQPFVDQPFTSIGADSKWSNSTHLGTEYAALLVQPGYHAAPKLQSLPIPGDGVVLVSTVKGGDAPPELHHVVHFSGYDWNIRATASERGGRVNLYEPANVWTDPNGALHLRITRKDKRWICAEASLSRSLGYGLYRFVLSDTSQLEPAVALDLFTWDDSGSDANHRELDVEISRWGDPQSKNAQYVVQPYYVPANVDRFLAPPGTLTHSFRWEPGKVSFRTLQDSNSKKPGRLIAEHVFTSGVPSAGDQSIHLAFYVFGSSTDPVRDETEVVVDKFEYLP